MIIFFSGNVGCGKTTLAKFAAKKLGFYYLDADKFKKRVYSPHTDPEKFFSLGKPVPAKVRARLYKKLRVELIKLSGKYENIILDETLHTMQGRAKLITAGKKYFKQPVIIQVKAPLKLIRARSRIKRKNHLLKNAYQMHLSIGRIARFHPKPDLIINNNTTIKKSSEKLISFLKKI